MIFDKALEQNCSKEIISIIKDIHKTPRTVYELDDLNSTPIDGQIYQEVLVQFRISKRKVYKIDKILSRSVKKGIREVLVKRKGYSPDFNICSLVAASRKSKAMEAHFLLVFFATRL
jgi:hypothetical protein